jgi:hypothetical protein
MKNNKILLIFVSLLIFTAVVSAAPPVTTTQNFQAGYVVLDSPQTILKQNEDFTVNFFVYNLSNGLLINNVSTECVYYLSNASGKVLYYSSVPYSNTGRYGHWELTLTKGNFTNPGTFYYGIKCNSTTLGGPEVGEYIVTPNSYELTASTSVILFLIFLVIVSLIVMCVVGVRNSVNGAWTIAYICMTYLFTYLLLGLFYIISMNYLWQIPIFESVFYITWFVMGIGFLPFVIIVTLYILGQEARAVLERNYIKQGYSSVEAKSLSRRRK